MHAHSTLRSDRALASLGSWRGGPAFGLYAATKWACSGLEEFLRLEVAPFGIDACVIEPGYFRSGFHNPGAWVQSEERIQYYEETLQEISAKCYIRLTTSNWGSEIIVDVLSKTGMTQGKQIPVRLVLGSDCQMVREKLEETKTLLNELNLVSDSTDNSNGA